MSYGLRRYETLHRLWWFIFFFLCLIFAGFLHSSTDTPRQGPVLADLGRIDFWTGLQGIGITSPGPGNSRVKQDRVDKGNQPGEPSAGQNGFRDDIELVSGALLFLIRAGIIFLGLRLLWLVVQYAGRWMLQLFMSEIRELEPSGNRLAGTRPESRLPLQLLDARIRRSALSFVLHPFIRLRLMLSSFHNNVSSEEVFEKERRAVEADWRILYSSWGPYRCLLWVIPILGLAQTVLLLIAQFNGAAFFPQKEALEAAKPLFNPTIQKQILDTVKPTLNLLLPLIQAAGVAIFFQLAATLLRHLEELYLSNLDAFIYDRLLSRLPLRSNDTVLILETLQQQYRELSAALKKLENKVLSPTGIEKQT